MLCLEVVYEIYLDVNLVKKLKLFTSSLFKTTYPPFLRFCVIKRDFANGATRVYAYSYSTKEEELILNGNSQSVKTKHTFPHIDELKEELAKTSFKVVIEESFIVKTKDIDDKTVFRPTKYLVIEQV